MRTTRNLYSELERMEPHREEKVGRFRKSRETNNMAQEGGEKI